MFSRILVPLDGTPESDAALPLARTLALATNALVTLLRVVPIPDLSSEPDATGTAESALYRISSELAEAGIQVEAILRKGEPADEIVDLVRDRRST